MLDIIVSSLQNHASSIVVSIIAIIVARYAKRLLNTIEYKFQIDIDDKAEKMILHLVRKAIRIVYQTFIKDEKDGDRWNSETKIEALHKAYSLVQQEARRSGLTSLLGDRDIINDIESELVKVKNKGKKAKNNFAKK